MLSIEQASLRGDDDFSRWAMLSIEQASLRGDDDFSR